MKTCSKIAYVPHPTKQRRNVNITGAKTENGKQNRQYGTQKTS
ncbi:hypothetical protein DOY81_011508 [Sarcophaga bullata]|nr:hypothetical protein DOY81_011508 [Sarcophaga bullata]